MEIMDSAWVFLQIILLDLALGGDNSIIIGMAARGLPVKQQKKVILFGTMGAILARFLLAAILVWLLAVPYLKTIGGVILLWIGMKLIGQEGKEEINVKSQTTFWGAVQTVVIADVIMSLDNVLAVVAATDGNLVLVIIGMLISVPIIIVGSTVVVKILNRFPWIIWVGALVIGWAAGGMMASDEFLGVPDEYDLALKIGMTAVVAAGGWIWKKMSHKMA